MAELQENLAFDLGIEWLVELVCFYGLMFVIAGYEIHKFEQARQELDNKLTNLEKDNSTRFE